MKILVTGGTGLVGRALIRRLTELQQPVMVLSRDTDGAKRKLGGNVEALAWQPEAGLPPAEAFAGVTGVVHLAGENVGDGRWTEARKRKIHDSRVLGTRHLVEAISKRKGPPLVFISASAVGIYGDRGDETLHESSSPGAGFLADVCRDWEREAKAVPHGNARLVIPRIGVVLGNGGGMLAKLLPVFRLGAGGPVGSGKQWLSWIHLEDLVGMIVMALQNSALEGAMNAVSPNPVTNADFSRQLGRALHRPAFFKAPAGLIKLAMGEMAEMALGSQRVMPEKALAAGYKFRFPTLSQALEDLVGARHRESGTIKTAPSSAGA